MEEYTDQPGRLHPLFDWRSAVCDSDLSPAQRHVLICLSLYMNMRGGSAFPGAFRLAHDTGLHLETVKRALRDSVAAGWLRVLKQGGSPGGGHRNATEYAAHVPDSYWKSQASGSTLTGSPEWSTGSPGLPDRKSQTSPSLKNSPNNSRDADFALWKTQASPSCLNCHGAGFAYHSGAGRETRCDCTKMYVPTERDE